MNGRDKPGQSRFLSFSKTLIGHKENNKKEQQDVEKDNKYRRVFLKK
jgi:hypothetical protein